MSPSGGLACFLSKYSHQTKIKPISHFLQSTVKPEEARDDIHVIHPNCCKSCESQIGYQTFQNAPYQEEIGICAGQKK